MDSRIDLIQQLHRLAEESVQVVRDTATAISERDLRGKEWARKQVDLLFDELRNHYTTLLWADDDRMMENENSPRTAKDRVLNEAFQKAIGPRSEIPHRYGVNRPRARHGPDARRRAPGYASAAWSNVSSSVRWRTVQNCMGKVRRKLELTQPNGWRLTCVYRKLPHGALLLLG